jgi:hypothetical protein
MLYGVMPQFWMYRTAQHQLTATAPSWSHVGRDVFRACSAGLWLPLIRPMNCIVAMAPAQPARYHSV